MPSDRPVFLPATAELAEAYWGGAPPYSFRGYVALLGTEVVGVGGVFRAQGRLWAFSGMKDAMRPFLKARARAARLLVSFADGFRQPVYAVADVNEPTSEPLLAKLGFVPTGELHEGQEILVRRP